MAAAHFADMPWQGSQRALLERLRESVRALHAHLQECGCGKLQSALHAHWASVGALHFELLVSPGLRAGPLERDAARFRREVAAVSECTEITWSALRQFMEKAAGHRAGTEALACDFALELRTIQRRVTDATQSAATMHSHLAARADALPGLSGKPAFSELVARNTVDCRLLETLQQLCDSARPAQGTAFQLAENQGALAGTLRGLAAKLRGGLLERLRVLVMGDVDAPGAELREAQQARAELQSALADAIAAAMRVQASCQDLAVWLHSIERDCAALATA